MIRSSELKDQKNDGTKSKGVKFCNHETLQKTYDILVCGCSRPSIS